MARLQSVDEYSLKVYPVPLHIADNDEGVKTYAGTLAMLASARR